MNKGRPENGAVTLDCRSKKSKQATDRGQSGAFNGKSPWWIHSPELRLTVVAVSVAVVDSDDSNEKEREADKEGKGERKD